MTTAGDEDGGGEGNRDAPPVTDRWVAAWPPGAVPGAGADADADTGTAGLGLLEYSVAGSERWFLGVVECRDLLRER